jgi:hypothetical protein
VWNGGKITAVIRNLTSSVMPTDVFIVELNRCAVGDAVRGFLLFLNFGFPLHFRSSSS